MRARHVVTIACVALLILAGSAGADEFGPPAPAVPEPVAAGPAETPAPTPTVAAESTPTPTAVPGATSEATPTPVAEPIAGATPTTVADAAEATSASAPTAVPAAAAEVTPTPIPMAVAEPAPSARRTSAPGPRATAVQEPAPPEPAPALPGECATPVEPLEGVEGVEETPSADGVCRLPSAVCTILGTDGDDVLTGSPFDDIMCGFGGNDRLEGGDGDDVLLGGEGDDELVGAGGDDCIVGGPGFDEADNTGGRGRPPADPEAPTTGGPQPEFPEVEISEPVGHSWYVSTGVTFDAEGRCTGAATHAGVAPTMQSPRPETPGAAPSGSAAAGVALVAGSATVSAERDGVRVRLPDRRLAVRNDVVRVPVSCSAVTPAELVLLAGSQRIARKRFTCRPTRSTVRARLNTAGRRLVARDERVQAGLLVLAAGQTASRQVVLISRG